MRFIALWIGFSTFTALGQSLPKITDANFQELHKLMQPTADELTWKEIDWHSNIWDARREAAEKGKPIYLWEMDGHPLGCT